MLRQITIGCLTVGLTLSCFAETALKVSGQPEIISGQKVTQISTNKQNSHKVSKSEQTSQNKDPKEVGLNAEDSNAEDQNADSQTDNPTTDTEVTDNQTTDAQAEEPSKPNPAKAIQALDKRVIDGNSVIPTTRFSPGKYIHYAALINIDSYVSSNGYFTHAPSTFAAFGGTTSHSQIYLNNANFFADAGNNIFHLYFNGGLDNHSEINPNTFTIQQQNHWDIPEAYFTLTHPKYRWLYIKAGQNYGMFGAYNPYNQFPDFTTLLSQSETLGGEVGLILPNSLFAKAAVFLPEHEAGRLDSKRDSMVSAKFGIAIHPRQYFNLLASVAYLNDVRGLSFFTSDDFAAYVQLLRGTQKFTLNKQKALMGNLLVQLGPFDEGFKVLTILNQINIIPSNGSPIIGTNGPVVFNAFAGYSFLLKKFPAHLAFSYQQSNAAAVLDIPKRRYKISFETYFKPFVALGFVLMYNENYRYAAVPNAKDSWVGGLRLNLNLGN